MNKETGKNRNAPANQIVRRILFLACGIAFALALTVAQPQPASANHLMPPEVPANLQVPPGNHLFRISHAVGTQNYLCLSTGWFFYGPQATLFNDEQRQTATHFLSPNPAESGTARATWQDSLDTSAVWAMAIASSTEPAFVASDAIPWLLLRVVGSQDGPTAGDKLTSTTFIQRVNTTGGRSPAGGCSEGDRALVHYTADYFFYRADDD